MARTGLVLALTAFSWQVTALQVSPNSPCSSVCLDASGLDQSDPQSSTTKNSDISCYDTDYTTTTTGEHFEACLQCLQDSKYSYGSENDQSWFLYNMRYTVDYCVFGFPNASGVASTPCSTSTACGGLENALTGDNLSADGAEQYGYCSADGGAMSGPSVSKCIACVAASGDQQYLTNYLVSMQVACQQRPAVGTLIGLNETVFSKTTIQAANAATSTASSNSKSGMSTPAIVGIVAGVIILFLLITAMLYIRHRKRRNRRMRMEGSPSYFKGPKTTNPNPTSPLSFRCQAQLSPQSAKFYTVSDGIVSVSSSGTGEKQDRDVSPYFDPASPDSPSDGAIVALAGGHSRLDGSAKARDTFGLQLQPIATSGPTKPNNVHYYNSSPRSKGHSPTEDTPIPDSTTSTRSTANLLPLKPYNPADYVGYTPTASRRPSTTKIAKRTTLTSDLPDATHVSPSSASTASPLISGLWIQEGSPWEMAQLHGRPDQHQGLEDTVSPKHSRSSPTTAEHPSRHHRMSNLGANVAETLGKGMMHKSPGSVRRPSGSPVETKQIQTIFPGPPRR